MSDSRKVPESNKEGAFSTQPHEAATNDPNDRGKGFVGDAIDALKSKPILGSSDAKDMAGKQPVSSREELQARTAELNKE